MLLAGNTPKRSRRQRLGLIIFMLLGVISAFAQPYPSYEFVGASAANINATGPVRTAQTYTFYSNPDNPSGSAYSASAVTATYSITGQNFTTTNSSRFGITFGEVNGSGVPIFSALSNGATAGGWFTSVAPASSQGIIIGQNHGVEMYTSALALRNAGNTNTGGRINMGSIRITFSSAVSNPVLHFADLGAAVSANQVNFQRFSTEFNVTTPNVSLVRLDGDADFVVSGNQINNGNPNPNTGAAAANGSVMIVGHNLTIIDLAVFLNGNGGLSQWSISNTFQAGDGFFVSASFPQGINLSGNLFNDSNGLNDNTVNGTPTGVLSGTQMYANLFTNTSQFLASVPINADGTYTFSNVAPSSDYIILINSTPGSSVSAVPATWNLGGENIGSGPGSDGTVDGQLHFSAGTTSMTNLNFGVVKITPWPCGESGYLFQNTNPGTSPLEIYAINLVTGGSTQVCSISALTDANSFGFNSIDGYFYGFNQNNGNVVRIGSNCRHEQFSITGLPNLDFYVGDMRPNSNIYYLFENGTGTNPDVLYRVNVSTGQLNGTCNLNIGRVADMAVNPVDNLIYTVSPTALNGGTGKIYRINPSNCSVTEYDITGAGVNQEAIGAMYFDNAGNLYLGQNDSGKILRVPLVQNITSGPVTATKFSTGPASFGNDGARCANAPITLDFGDAPSSYKTLLADDGPRHNVGATAAVRFGAAVTDGEEEGLPDTGAVGDDSSGIDDEDLVMPQLSTVMAGATQTWTFPVQNTSGATATAYMWIDFNQNGAFNTAELVTASVPNNATTVSFTFNVPAGITAGTYYARFRITTYDIMNRPTGPASDGEVEDHTVLVLGVTEPDINVGFVDQPITGDVSTNDNVEPGSTYGTPTANAGNPSTTLPTVNPDGSYTFTTSVPGEYNFIVPVCAPGGSPCVNELLTITVEDPAIVNPPVANTDVATTQENTAVTINSLANDDAGVNGNPLDPASVTITNTPENGTATVNPATGEISYTPNTGFAGTDTIVYQVCSQASPVLCDTAYQIITVLPTGAPNSTDAADDYTNTAYNTATTGNVLTNDGDPEGNTQTVTAQNVTTPQGTLVLNSDGTYTFTPAPGFSGSLNYTYKVCDNGMLQACDSATLYITVTPPVMNTEPDINVGLVGQPITGDVSTNDNVEPGSTYGTPTANAGNPSTTLPTVNPDGSYTFTTSVPGEYNFIVPVCAPGGSPCVDELLTITVEDPAIVNPPVANTDVATTQENTAVTINSLANDDAGVNGNPLDPASVTITNTPENGTATVNPATGEISYTPNTGFAGTDTIVYQVCSQAGPVLCDTAYQIITVLPTGAPNSTDAADDYNNTPYNTAASGNVLDNDSDPEGNTQTVTAQNVTTPQGTLVLNSDGTYTFTPAPGISGSFNYAYKVCDNGTPQACDSATLYITVEPELQTNPDINDGLINIPISGDVSTNDNMPAGSTYGTPAPLSSNPPGATINMNTDGTYTFTATQPGVYTYMVPVCVPDMSSGCPLVPLVITVTDPAVLTNPPVANNDYTTTDYNTPVTYPILANDGPGNQAGSLSAPTLVGGNNPGSTVTVNPDGTVTYTPAPGFVGKDTLTFQVCETPGGLCATEELVVTVLSPTAPNTVAAADDYISTIKDVPVGGSVSTNDHDPDGTDTLSYTPQNVTIAGQGTLVLNSDGTYTFTPATGFVGSVSFPYTVCDNGVPQACAQATLYVVVKEELLPDLTPTTVINNLNFTPNQTKDFVVNIFEINSISTRLSPEVSFVINKISGWDITVPGITLSATNQPGVSGTSNVGPGIVNDNSLWYFRETSGFIIMTLKEGETIPGNGVSKLGFIATRKAGTPDGTTQNITATIINGSGQENNYLNNQVITNISSTP